MPRRARLAIAVLLALAAAPAAHAVQHFDASVQPASRMELIVIEVPGCYYCRVFRRNVLPIYESSPHAREVPMRMLDRKAAVARGLAFSRPIDVIPTVVLFRDGKEAARIAGYRPPENLLRYINALISLQR
jgi:thioredoxin-related protein